jgi:transcriptional regulator of acetoin/glycerol metabolism
MAIEAQVNLLRFLQEGTIDRLGDNRSRSIDTRVLSATHVDLPTAISSGRFRQDLYYRLCVCQLHLPPLRERRSGHSPAGQTPAGAKRPAAGFATQTAVVRGNGHHVAT